MQKAYAQANDTINAANKQAQEILDSATQDANSIRLSAITYTDDMMANIGSVLNTTLEDAGVKYKRGTEPRIEKLLGIYHKI